jgi:tRNA pseudouridine55 synthase
MDRPPHRGAAPFARRRGHSRVAEFIEMTHSGIINVNKPAGFSSRDIVDRVETLVRPARCGHAGTLDPLATGVLVICVGAATRLIQYVQRMPKQYRAVFLLGQKSPTDDIEGEVTRLAGVAQPTRAEIEAALPPFIGEIEQRPPAHSAVKVAGRRAYALARRGQSFELAPRTVSIYALEVTQYEFPRLELAIACGSGMYVRSLGRDLAAALGTAAVMAALERTAVGGFRVEDAVRIDELTIQSLRQHVQPALAAVPGLRRLTVSDAELAEIRQGRPIDLRHDAPPFASEQGNRDDWAATNSAGELVAILREKERGRLWPVRNLS